MFENTAHRDMLTVLKRLNENARDHPMWKSNLIIALRVLGRNKTISLINIVGLSVAFAVAVLCLLFVRHETSFDAWHEKGDRIFAIYYDPLEPEPGAPSTVTLR